MPLECTAIEAQTWLLLAFVWGQFVHCQIREIPKRPIRGLYPDGVSCKNSSFILKEKWEAVKNRSLAHCSEYDFCKSDFTLSKIRENEVLLCRTMVWALWITQIDFEMEMNTLWGGNFMKKVSPWCAPDKAWIHNRAPARDWTAVHKSIEITSATSGRKYRREDLY